MSLPRRVLGRVASAAGVLGALAAASLPTPVAAGVLALALAWGAGAVLARLLPADRGVAARAAATLAFAPFAAGAPFAALLALGWRHEEAARVVVGLLALAALAVPSPEGGGGRTSRWEWMPAVAWTALVALLLVGNPWLPPRSDGWFHAGVTLQLVDRGVPPEDPYFGGLRLLYFWGTHAWAALWLTLAPGLSVWTPLIALNLAAAAATLLAITACARTLGASAPQSTLAAGLAVVVQAPLAWLQVAARAASGEVRGWPEVERLVAAGADPLLDLLARGQLHASLAFHGDKALVLTPFGMGLALFALGLDAGTRLHHRPGVRAALVLALVLAAALFIHTVVGYTLGMLVASWAAVQLPGLMRGEAAPRTRVLALAAAGVAAVLVVAPYVLAVTLGKQGQLALGVSGASVRSLVLGSGLALALAWTGLRVLGVRAAEPVALTLGVLAVLALALRLPESNQSKFLNLLFVAAAIPAGTGLAAWHARCAPGLRPAFAVALAVVLLPTPALALWGFAREHGQSHGSHRIPDAGTREVFTWARAHTPPATLFADLGGARELFTISGRTALWGGASGERDWGYPPAALAMRRRLVRALCAGHEPVGEDRAWLLALARPVVVVSRASEPESGGALQAARAGAPGFRLLHGGGSVALVAWEPRP
jgi:hypothetical protein